MTQAQTQSEQGQGALPGAGVYHDMPEADYHKLPYVSKSKLWRMHKVMDLEYDPEQLQKLILSERPETDALRMGRLVDDLLFAGRDEAMKRYRIGPTKTTEAKAWREWEAELPEGVSGITEKFLKDAEQMAESIARHPVARQLLIDNPGKQQLSVIADHPATQLMCKGRIDRLTKYDGASTHVDLKTCRDIKWFEKDATDYGYWIQSAHYLDLCQRLDVLNGSEPKNRRFVFVAIEKTDSPEARGYHRVQCFEYGINDLDSALRMRDSLLEKWRVLFGEGRYPGEWPSINQIRISEKAENQHAA